MGEKLRYTGETIQGKLQTSCHAAIGVGVSLSILVSHVSPIIY